VIPSLEGGFLILVVVMGRFELDLKVLVCLFFIAAVAVVVSADQQQHENSVVHATASSTTSSDAKFYGGGHEDWSYSSPSPYGGSSPLIPVYGPSSGASPSSGPGTCDFWSSHTSSLPSFMSIFDTIVDLFGLLSSGTFGSSTTLLQALTNTRPDAYGALLRQGSAALINSYNSPSFAYSPQQVRESFNAALFSEPAAAVQAVRFENANRGYVLRAP
jgi:hypothetical protein